MVELGPKIAAKATETFKLNWQFRKRYLLTTVIPYEQMQHIEHNAPYYMIHYLSEQYGASEARMTESEWQDLLEEPGVKTAFDQIPFSDTSTDEPYVVPEERTLKLKLAEAIEQPLLKLTVETDGEPLDADNTFFTKQVELLATQPATDMGTQMKQAWPAAMQQVIAERPDAATIGVSLPETELLYMPGSSSAQVLTPEQVASITPDDMDKLKAHGIVEEVKAPITGPPVPDTSKHADVRIVEQPLNPIDAEQAKGRVRSTRKSQKKPVVEVALPAVPEPVALKPLVLPDFKSLLMAAPMEDTPERRFVTHPTDMREGYIVRGTATDTFPTLFDAIMWHGYLQGEGTEFYQAAFGTSGIAPLGTGGKPWSKIPFELVLSTATAFFAGRVLGIVLTHFKGSDEPQGDLVHHWLLGQLGDMGNQMTPESVLMAIEHESHRTNPDSLDRLRLPIRLLHQLVAVARQPISAGGVPDKAPQTAKDYHELVWGCRRICWHLNITTPSGYQFLRGMLSPHRIFFSKAESALLGMLLTSTNKLKR